MFVKVTSLKSSVLTPTDLKYQCSNCHSNGLDSDFIFLHGFYNASKVNVTVSLLRKCLSCPKYLQESSGMDAIAFYNKLTLESC